MPLRVRSYGNLTIMSSDSLAGEHSSGEVSPYIGALLGVVWQWVREQMYAGVVAAGFDDLNAAHVGLWRYPGLDGLRPSQLADQRGITKQSVNDLLGHLERHGYLVREPDSADGRARVIRLTSKGRRFSRQFTPRRVLLSWGLQRSWGRGASPSYTAPLSCWPSSSQLHWPSPDTGSEAVMACR